MALLEVDHVSFEHGGKTILRDITFQVDQQDFILITGSSGSGKSTLLKLCCHLLSPTEGNLAYKGKCFSEYDPIQLRQNLAYCFQTPCLFGSTVLENISFPFYVRNAKYDSARVNSLFSRFQLSTDYLERDVRLLSGGERQRIALIRSLVFRPEVLLLDEVTSALDLNNAKIVENVLLSLNQEGITVIWITHSPEQSAAHANKLITIESGTLRSMEATR